MIGVDGSPESQAALRWAVREAGLRKAKLVVLHAWWAMPELYLDAAAPIDDQEAGGERPSTVHVDAFVDSVAPEARSTVELETRAVQGIGAAEALLEAAKDADLLVVGSRGLGGFSSLVLGSVSSQCVHHAPCPVVVVRS